MGAAEQLRFGNYQLLEQISAGGMGVVYRARHTLLGHEAAIKILPASLAADSDSRQLFARGAASAAGLNHPNILPTLEYGEDEGHLYLVMPLIRGGTLKERILAGPVAPARAADYLRQLAAALDFAHAHRIVHRDVKPQNVLVEVIDGAEHLFLADFGIAKALEGASGLTRTGASIGTPEYMAPEQARGQADPRSDLYSLGIILYQLLTGTVPYSGTTAVEVLMKHLRDPLPQEPLRRVRPPLPGSIDRVLQRALAKEPDLRYQSGQALLDDFMASLADREVIRRVEAAAHIPEVREPGLQSAVPPQSARLATPATIPDFPTAATRYSPPDPILSAVTAPRSAGVVSPQPARRRPLILGLAAALVVAVVGCLGVGGAGAYVLRATPAPVTRQVALVEPTATSTATPAPPTATAVPPSPAPFASAKPSPSPTSRPSPSPSPRPSASPAPKLTGPYGVRPTGWSTYAGDEQFPFAIYYPPGWSATPTTDGAGIIFRAPVEQVAFLVTVSPASADANINGLRDDVKKILNRQCAQNPKCARVDDVTTANDTIGGTVFAWQLMVLRYKDGSEQGYRAGEAVKNGYWWHYEFVAPEPSYFDTYLLPMLNSLNIYATPAAR